MSTFHDPGADAGEASEALRGLAHASRNFEHPGDLYGVLGDLLYGVRSMRQVLDQLARAHADHRPLALTITATMRSAPKPRLLPPTSYTKPQL